MSAGETWTSSQPVEISGKKYLAEKFPKRLRSLVILVSDQRSQPGSAWHFTRIFTYPVPSFVKTTFRFIVPMNYDRGSSTILLYIFARHPSFEDKLEDDHDRDDHALGSSSKDGYVLGHGHAADRG